MRNEARMRDGLATPRYWWGQAKIIDRERQLLIIIMTESDSYLF